MWEGRSGKKVPSGRAISVLTIPWGSGHAPAGEERPEPEHFVFEGWILPSCCADLSCAWLRLWRLCGKAVPPCRCLSFPISKPWPIVPHQCLRAWSSAQREERRFRQRVGADGVGGSGTSARARRAPSAASHPRQPSAHVLQGLATFAGRSRAGSVQKGTGADGDSVWGGHR